MSEVIDAVAPLEGVSFTDWNVAYSSLFNGASVVFCGCQCIYGPPLVYFGVLMAPTIILSGNLVCVLFSGFRAKAKGRGK